MSKGRVSQSQEARRSERGTPRGFKQDFKVLLKTVWGPSTGRTWGKQGAAVMVQMRKEGPQRWGHKVSPPGKPVAGDSGLGPQGPRLP